MRELLLADDAKPLVEYEDKLGSEAMLAVPTPDHYLPLLYVIGTRTASDAVTFPVGGTGRRLNCWMETLNIVTAITEQE